MSLNPYTGEWNANLAAHLLRRTSFVPRKKYIDKAVADGLSSTVADILTLKTGNDEPLNYFFTADPFVEIGESWVDAPTSIVPGLTNYRNKSMAGWISKKMLEDSVSIQEKLTLFWQNHFVVADNVNDPRMLYRNFILLRDNALGNFNQLVKDVTIDPSMLRYLNGRQNSKQAPNENYARELLELFTIGKGDIAGPGDYTTFTEDDVVAMAKVLTGWVDRGHNNGDGIEIGAEFIPSRHDTSTKQLSPRFNSETIADGGAEEYKTLIDIIFQQEEVSRFIVRQLYRWFVFYDLSESVESEIIEPLAEILRQNNYEIKPVLEVLLNSEHFYDNCFIGAMIKSPMDYLMNTIGLFEADTDIPELKSQYFLWYGLLEGSALLQQSIYNQPNVAGWKAYYQAPVYYRIWLNSVTLPLRSQVMDILWITGVNISGGLTFKMRTFDVLENVSDATDINILITEITNYILPKPINASQLSYLKNVVLQGLPDFEWQVEYVEYLSNPDDENIKQSIDNKLRLLFLSICRLPEFHLS